MNKQRKVKEKYTPGSKVLTVFFIALCLVWVIPCLLYTSPSPRD